MSLSKTAPRHYQGAVFDIIKESVRSMGSGRGLVVRVLDPGL